jgi:L-cysteine desulfidase
MNLHEFFKDEVKPALGCTEPGAVAFTAATAARHFEGEIEHMELKVSVSIFKNGLDVGVPGAEGLRGNEAAAALGALAGDPDKGLMALEGTSQADGARAKALVDGGKLTMEVVENTPSVFVEVTLENATCRATATVAHRHDTVQKVVKDGDTVFATHALGGIEQPAYLDELAAMDFQTLWNLAGTIDKELEDFLLEGVVMNMALARMGLEKVFGLGVGRTIQEHGGMDDLLSKIKGTTGAAADVRMAGAPYPVMSSAGSGNHGITAILPVSVAAEHQSASPRQLAEALALSHLVTGLIKAHTGRLTPICGCSVAAGAGAAAGIVRIMDGSCGQAEHASASLISSLMGMLCDGAKGSCGLKVSTAAGEAYTAAMLALENRGVQKTEGVVGPDLPTTARALAMLSKQGFAMADHIMVKLLRGEQ